MLSKHKQQKAIKRRKRIKKGNHDSQTTMERFLRGHGVKLKPTPRKESTLRPASLEQLEALQAGGPKGKKANQALQETIVEVAAPASLPKKRGPMKKEEVSE